MNLATIYLIVGQTMFLHEIITRPEAIQHEVDLRRHQPYGKQVIQLWLVVLVYVALWPISLYLNLKNGRR